MSLIMPAYSFPRAMPLRSDQMPPYQAVSFDIAYAQAEAPTRGGLQQSVNLAPDYWTMDFQCHPLDEAEGLQFQAWLQSLRGGARLFKAWHPLLEFPQGYPDGWESLVIAGGSTPFAGLGDLTDIGTGRDTCTVSNLPAFFEMAIGDMISVELPNSSRSLHRVMADAAASSGGDIDLRIEPILPRSLVESPAAEVLFEKPYCLAKLDPQSVRGPWDSNAITSISFSAWQTY